MPDANVSYEYYCRGCRGTLFRVAWYVAPLAPDGSPRPPGWAIECAGCGRVTLIPEAPDLDEVRPAPENDSPSVAVTGED